MTDRVVSPRHYLALVGLGAAIGIPAAFLGAAFLALVNVCETALWTNLPKHLGASEPPWYLVVFLPVVGAVVVWVARRFLPGDGGHEPLRGISAVPTPLRSGPGVALAALGTLAFGAVLGPEAPLIALGSVVGMAVTPFIRLEPRAQQVLATAGSFSAISALFGGPLVAGILLLEGGLAAGSALIPALVPGLVAAATGYVIFIGLGSWGGINEAGLTVPGLPEYQGTHVTDLLVAILVGILAALLMAPVRGYGARVAAIAARPGRHRMLVVLVASGAVVGVIAEVTRLLGGDSQAALFSGEAAVPELVAQTSAGLVLLALAVKAIGYSICLGSGFRGGPVFPAIYLGIAIATLAVVLLGVSPTWAVAAGAAAGMTAGTGLVFSSLLFATLLVGEHGLDTLPAAVLAAVAAWLTKTALEHRSAAKTAT